MNNCIHQLNDDQICELCGLIVENTLFKSEQTYNDKKTNYNKNSFYDKLNYKTNKIKEKLQELNKQELEQEVFEIFFLDNFTTRLSISDQTCLTVYYLLRKKDYPVLLADYKLNLSCDYVHSKRFLYKNFPPILITLQYCLNVFERMWIDIQSTQQENNSLPPEIQKNHQKITNLFYIKIQDAMNSPDPDSSVLSLKSEDELVISILKSVFQDNLDKYLLECFDLEKFCYHQYSLRKLLCNPKFNSRKVFKSKINRKLDKKSQNLPAKFDFKKLSDSKINGFLIEIQKNRKWFQY